MTSSGLLCFSWHQSCGRSNENKIPVSQAHVQATHTCRETWKNMRQPQGPYSLCQERIPHCRCYKWDLHLPRNQYHELTSNTGQEMHCRWPHCFAELPRSLFAFREESPPLEKAFMIWLPYALWPAELLFPSLICICSIVDSPFPLHFSKPYLSFQAPFKWWLLCKAFPNDPILQMRK